MLQAFNAADGAFGRAPEVKAKVQTPAARPAAPTSMGKIFLIVGVAIVRDRGVAAGGSMSVVVAVVSGVFRHRRGILLILRAPPAGART